MTLRAQRWLRAIASIADPVLRTGFVRSEVLGRPAAEVADALDEICAAAQEAAPAARDVLAALAPALVEEALRPRLEELRALAQERSLRALGRLLLRASSETGDPPAEEVPAPIPILGGERPLTLGERKAFARRPTRRSLETLMRDPHPMVVRTLLGNPRVTEDDVVRMAARRPASPEALAEIARSPRWSLRPRIRVALVRNPATPPFAALALLRLLRRTDLEDLTAGAGVAPSVREAAAELLNAELLNKEAPSAHPPLRAPDPPAPREPDARPVPVPSPPESDAERAERAQTPAVAFVAAGGRRRRRPRRARRKRRRA